MFSNGLPCNLPFPSCLGVPKASESDELLPTSMGNREPVILNVYDMVGISVGWWDFRQFIAPKSFAVWSLIEMKFKFIFNKKNKKK